MKLRTTTKDACDASDACQEALIRGGFEDTTYSSRAFELRLGGDKPGEAYDVWFPRDGYRWYLFFRIHKGTIGPASNSSVDWDWTSEIRLKLI